MRGEHAPQQVVRLPASFDDLAPRAAHGFFATALALLIAAHVAAALYHQFIRKDGLLGRMWFGKRSGRRAGRSKTCPIVRLDAPKSIAYGLFEP